MGTMTRVMERLQEELEAQNAENALGAPDSSAPETQTPAPAAEASAKTNFVADPLTVETAQVTSATAAAAAASESAPAPTGETVEATAGAIAELVATITETDSVAAPEIAPTPKTPINAAPSITKNDVPATQAPTAADEPPFIMRADVPEPITVALVETPEHSDALGEGTLSADIVNEIESPTQRPVNNALLSYEPPAGQQTIQSPRAADAVSAPLSENPSSPAPVEAATPAVEAVVVAEDVAPELPAAEPIIAAPVIAAEIATAPSWPGEPAESIDIAPSIDAVQASPPAPASAVIAEPLAQASPPVASDSPASTPQVNPFADPTNIVRLVAATIAELRKSESVEQPVATSSPTTPAEEAPAAEESSDEPQPPIAQPELSHPEPAATIEPPTLAAEPQASSEIADEDLEEVVVETTRDSTTVTCSFTYDAPDPVEIAALERSTKVAAAPTMPSIPAAPAPVRAPEAVIEPEAPIAAAPSPSPVARIEYQATTPTPPPQRSRLQGNPALGICSLSAAGVDSSIVSLRDRFGAMCEQFRAAATRLLSLNPSGHPQAIAVTSSLPREGKSVFVTNVALALAEGGHRRVILADADLRSGTVARLLSASSERGVADYLSGAGQITDFIQDTGIENFQIVSAGRLRDRSAAELLGGPRLDALIAELRRHADYVLIDTPAVLHCADASMIGAHCDGALLVIAGGRTNEESVSDAARTLRGNNVKLLGCILTACEDPNASRHEHRH